VVENDQLVDRQNSISCPPCKVRIGIIFKLIRLGHLSQIQFCCSFGRSISRSIQNFVKEHGRFVLREQLKLRSEKTTYDLKATVPHHQFCSDFARMGQSCSKTLCHVTTESSETGNDIVHTECPDPAIYDLMKRSISLSEETPHKYIRNPNNRPRGQGHLLFRHNRSPNTIAGGLLQPESTSVTHPTRLLVRRPNPREENHIYAIRYPETGNQINQTIAPTRQEQCPPRNQPLLTTTLLPPVPKEGTDVFVGTMGSTPQQQGKRDVSKYSDFSPFID
jgi:hypothetical protein